MSAASPLLAALRAAHAAHVPLADVPPQWRPASEAEAYACAAQLVRDRGEVAGWKVGATAAAGRRMLGLAEPFYGRIFADTVHRSPATVASRGRTLALEPEVGFAMARTLAPRGRPWSLEEVLEATAAVVALIEINWPAYARPFELGGLCLIADNGVNAGLVVGEPQPLPPLRALAAVEATAQLDGTECARGHGDVVMDNPANALLWLANALNRHGLALEAGQLVAAGALTRPIDAAAGQQVRVQIGSLGTVSVTLQG